MNEIRTITVGRCAGATVSSMRRGLAQLAVLLAGLVLVLPAVGGATHEATAPSIAGTTLTGTKLALRDLRGKPVVINVWSSW